MIDLTIKERLMEDFKAAMKAKDQVARDTISFARAAIKQHEVDNREELDDDGVIAILSKQVKDVYKRQRQVIENNVLVYGFADG